MRIHSTVKMRIRILIQSRRVQMSLQFLCPHVDDWVIACGEKYGTPLVKTCLASEPGFSGLLPRTREQYPGVSGTVKEGIVSDLEFSSHGSHAMLLAKRYRDARAHALRRARGPVRAGALPANLCLRDQLKVDTPVTRAPGLEWHTKDMAHIYANAAAHRAECVTCGNISQLMKRPFWQTVRPHAIAQDDEGADDHTSNCIVVVQTLGENPQVAAAFCDKQQWQQAVILSQFGVLPFPELEKPATWNVAMVVRGCREFAKTDRESLETLRRAKTIEEMRTRVVQDLCSSAIITLNHGLFMARPGVSVFTEQQCSEGVAAISIH